MSKTERKVEEGARGAKRGEAAEPTRSTSSNGGRSSGGMEHDRGLLARPLVIPEIFYGTGSWSDWSFHFENVAAVNGWNDAQKLQWLRVRVTVRAHKALHRLRTRLRGMPYAHVSSRSRVTRGTKPSSRRDVRGLGKDGPTSRMTSGIWQTRPTLPSRKKPASDYRSTPTTPMQLPQPQISFSVRQKQPSSPPHSMTP